MARERHSAFGNLSGRSVGAISDEGSRRERFAVHSRVSVRRKEERSERVRAPPSPESRVNTFKSSSTWREEKFCDGSIGILSAVVSENGFVLVSGSENNQNTLSGDHKFTKKLKY